MSVSKRMSAASTAAFTSFGIAIGYGSNLGIPDRNLWILSVGLALCAIAFAILKNWNDSLQTLLLVTAVATLLTPRLLSAIWTIVFLLMGCLFFVLKWAFRR